VARTLRDDLASRWGIGAWFAYALAPVARYQPALGRALGKWLLSLSANSRLYWPDSLPSDQQCNPGDPGHGRHCH
jgi:hypothetical protein